jgi:hypothetical protein
MRAVAVLLDVRAESFDQSARFDRFGHRLEAFGRRPPRETSISQLGAGCEDGRDEIARAIRLADQFLGEMDPERAAQSQKELRSRKTIESKIAIEVAFQPYEAWIYEVRMQLLDKRANDLNNQGVDIFDRQPPCLCFRLRVCFSFFRHKRRPVRSI